MHFFKPLLHSVALCQHAIYLNFTKMQLYKIHVLLFSCEEGGLTIYNKQFLTHMTNKFCFHVLFLWICDTEKVLLKGLLKLTNCFIFRQKLLKKKCKYYLGSVKFILSSLKPALIRFL